MENRICAVIDKEEGFVTGLADYLSRARSFPFSVQAFTDADKLRVFAGHERLHLLLAGAQLREEIADIPCECRITMGDPGDPENAGENPAADVVRYQPADVLARQVLDLYAMRQRNGNVGEVSYREEVEGSAEEAKECTSRDRFPSYEERRHPGWIGIYSPVGRCGKTGFAIALGEILSRKKKTVYINLEEYHGLARMWPDSTGTGDLSDLLYFFRQGDGNLYLRISGMLKTFRDLDYIPPTLNGWDLKEVDAGEWISLFSAIEEGGEYDYLVLDLGPQVHDVFRILEQCGRVIVPGRSDPVSEAKLEQFRANLATLGRRDLAARMQQVICPEEKSGLQPQAFVAQLLKGKTGQLAAELAGTFE